MFDSDDEEDSEINEATDTTHDPLPQPSESTVDSASLFEDIPGEIQRVNFPSNVKSTLGQHVDSIRRPSFLIDPEEASMPPLVLNESFDSDESNSTHNPIQMVAKSIVTKVPPTLNINPESDSHRTECEADLSKETSLMEAGDEGSLDTTGLTDNSLEMSFQWGGQTLPPAQLQQEGSSGLPEKVSRDALCCSSVRLKFNLSCRNLVFKLSCLFILIPSGNQHKPHPLLFRRRSFPRRTHLMMRRHSSWMRMG